jgi:hypothetical protein
MGFNFDITAAQQITKVRYTDKTVETLAFSDPLLGMMPKKEGMGGANYTGAIRSAVGSAISPSDTTAFTTGGSSIYNQWVCQWGTLFGSANVTGTAIARTKGDPNAFVEAITGEFDGLFIGLGMTLTGFLYGNGGGSIGQINSTSTPSTSQIIQLADPSQAVNFWQGQILNASTDDGTGGAGILTGTVVVGSVDPITGNIGVTASNWSGITSIAASCYLFNQGSYNATPPGLAGWLPDDQHRPTVSSPNFNGVPRYVDSRLSGAYYFGNGNPYSESLVQLATLMARYGAGKNGKPLKGFINYLAFAQVVKEQMGKAVIATDTAFKAPQVGFTGVRLMGANGPVDIYPSSMCPQNHGYILEMDKWLIPSEGKLPRVFTDDNQTWLRGAGADTYQLRGGTRGWTTYCSDPSHQGVVRFA